MRFSLFLTFIHGLRFSWYGSWVFGLRRVFSLITDKKKERNSTFYASLCQLVLIFSVKRILNLKTTVKLKGRRRLLLQLLKSLAHRWDRELITSFVCKTVISSKIRSLKEMGSVIVTRKVLRAFVIFCSFSRREFGKRKLYAGLIEIPSRTENVLIRMKIYEEFFWPCFLQSRKRLDSFR